MALTRTGPPETRSAILDAAELEFGRLGYQGTTIGGVADAAGVSRPLVHRYFGDKEGLYRQVVERVLRLWNDVLVEVADQNAPSTAHTLGNLIAACLDWGRDHPMLLGVLVRDASVTHRVAGDVLAEGRDRLPRLLERVITDGQQRGDIRGDLPATELATVIAEVTIAGSLRAMHDRPDDSASVRSTAIIEVVLHGVGLPGDPRRDRPDR